MLKTDAKITKELDNTRVEFFVQGTKIGEVELYYNNDTLLDPKTMQDEWVLSIRSNDDEDEDPEIIKQGWVTPKK